MEITKTVLSLMLVVITILTTLTVTTTIAAYAGGDDNGDENKQKPEDDSAAAIADCDDNEVERAGFDCIAIAANDVEIEPPKATISVCKEVANLDVEPDDFTFTVTGNNPSPEEFDGSVNCVDVTIGPGEYVVMEVAPEGLEPNFGTFIREGSDCVHNPLSDHSRRATGGIQAGETQECRFVNHALN